MKSLHLLLGLTFISLNASIASADIASESVADANFVKLEFDVMNCHYAKSIGLPFDDAKKSFGLTKELITACPQTKLQMKSLYNAADLSILMDRATVKYPFYREIAKRNSSITFEPDLKGSKRELELRKLRTSLDAAGLSSASHSVTKRSDVVNSWRLPVAKINEGTKKEKAVNILEADIRKILNLNGQPNPCNRNFSPELVAEEANPDNAYDLLRWKTKLHQDGYNCTARLYFEVSDKMNQSKNLASAQSIFEKSLQNIPSSTIETLPAEVRTGDTYIRNYSFSVSVGQLKAIIFFPPLGYDLPVEKPDTDGPRELLTMTEWHAKKSNIHYPSLSTRFMHLGIPLEVIHRVTLENVEDQIQSSQASFLLNVEKYIKSKEFGPNTRFIVVGRSMGGYIAREVLARSKNIRLSNGKTVQQVVDVAVLIGATPFGSVIAHYKSRSDVYDDTYTKLGIPDYLHGLALFFLDIIKHKDKDTLKASLSSENVGSMSHTKHSVNDIKKSTEEPYKVLNVIMLKPTLEGYYNNAPNSEWVDPAFMFMSMFGPTEGSAPLTHASWDTSNSARVFVKTHNHLAFWELEPKEAMNVLMSSIDTAIKLGMSPLAK